METVFIEEKHALPGKRWGTLAGDSVHNLRAVLDNLVWLFTIANGNIPPKRHPIPRRSKWRKVAWPIYQSAPFKDAAGHPLPWTRSKRPEALWGVDETFITVVDNLQPYQMPREKRHLHAHWVLNELWNIDKHRTINVVGVATERVVLHLFPEHGKTFTFEGRVRFENGAELGDVAAGWVNLDVQPTLRFRTFFEEGNPFESMPVLETLGVLYTAVDDVLKGCEYALPILSPLP